MDLYLDNWISQTYLSMDDYGVGFTIIAEAYLNGGLLFSPIIMMVLGYFIGRQLYINNLQFSNPQKVFWTMGSLLTLITVTRSSLELSLRRWFYGVVIMMVLFKFAKVLFRSNAKGGELNDINQEKKALK